MSLPPPPMSLIINRLEKVAPPPFLTVPVPSCPSGGGTQLLCTTTSSALFKSPHTTLSSLLSQETHLLRSFVTRKGTQLRLEKAMMLTTRVMRVVDRWVANDAATELNRFVNAFENSSGGGGGGSSSDKGADDHEKKQKRKGKKKKFFESGGGALKTTTAEEASKTRVPSQQWSNWVVYVLLRELLLLVKIHSDCAHTFPYWLGLISCDHHPGDSLVIVAILARIWSLSSSLASLIMSDLHPALTHLGSLLPPTNAAAWPASANDDEDVCFPQEDLHEWIEQVLGFPFQPVAVGPPDSFLTAPDDSTPNLEKILHSAVVPTTPSSSPKKSKQKKKAGARTSQQHHHQSTQNVEDEDVGVPVSRTQSSARSTTTATSTKLPAPWRNLFKLVKQFTSEEESSETPSSARSSPSPSSPTKSQLLRKINKTIKKNAGDDSPATHTNLLTHLRKLVRCDRRKALKKFLPILRAHVRSSSSSSSRC